MIQQFCTTATDQTALALTTWGDAPSSIVLIHGFADGRYLWSPFAPSLADYAGVLAMDLRGHGDSEWDPDGAYDVDRFVADAQTVLDRLCSDELVLVGHSLGAEIALRLSAANEARIRALVMIDGGSGLRTGGMVQMRGNFSSRPRDFGSQCDYLQALSDWMPLADSEMLELATQQAIKQVTDGYRLKCDPRLAQLELPDGTGRQWPLLESLHCESLLIRGEASAILPRNTAAEMVHCSRNLRLETVAMAGHAVMMDNPKHFGSILRSFVAGIYSTSGVYGRSAAAMAL